MQQQYSLKLKEWLPKLQSHRGYWVKGVRQNTLSSIKAAYDLGYEMSEFDVRLTKDSVVILFHDSHFQNRYISDMTYQEINNLTEITTLEELIIWFKDTPNFKLNIEIKNRNFMNYRLEKSVAELIKKYNIEERVLISSFNFATLFKMRLFSPRVFRAFLLCFERHTETQFRLFFWILRFFSSPHMFNLRFDDFSGYFRKLSGNIPIVLWTVNDIAVFKNNKNYIHGIISDSITPNEIKEVLNA